MRRPSLRSVVCRGFAPALLFFAAAACGHAEAGAHASAPARGDTIAVDRDRCVLPAAAPADSLQAAVRCAELFVARNGYTGLPPVADSAQIVWEYIEGTLENRRNTLERRAHAACPRGARGFAVLFRSLASPRPAAGDPPGAPPVPLARVVEVRPDFSGLRLVHQYLILGDSTAPACRAFPRG